MADKTYKTRDDLLKENKNLTNELSEIRKMVEELIKNNSSSNSENVVLEKEVEKSISEDFITPIEPNKYIRVTSLCNGKLNLTPQTHGKGNPIIFHTFGQSRNIPFQMLEEIVNANRKMAENGRYYIQDQKAVRLLMLENVYDNILDEKAIKTIVENKDSNIIEVFKLAPKKQQEHIVSMIIKRVLDGQSFDFNVLSEISDIHGKDLLMKINEAKSRKNDK